MVTRTIKIQKVQAYKPFLQHKYATKARIDKNTNFTFRLLLGSHFTKKNGVE